ncbi:hypothetical protein CAEBREN_05972 [Caenorhabditis brenneri]|uniref:Uncharacterized protein n=1 Tax=Caenorhabditis brenneri TaxID=135651 RepID=G0PDP3_CAEBE|nr:hypothetical protein CAEBREN_05972 [Caenorhabditis brenneri]
MSPVIVFIMLFAPTLCDDPPKPDLGSQEEFLKEVNEYRAKFAKERKIPNMYKLTMLTDKRSEVLRIDRNFDSESYRNTTEKISKRVNQWKEELNANKIKYRDSRYGYLELLNPLHAFIECSLTGSQKLEYQLLCSMRFS